MGGEARHNHSSHLPWDCWVIFRIEDFHYAGVHVYMKPPILAFANERCTFGRSVLIIEFGTECRLDRYPLVVQHRFGRNQDRTGPDSLRTASTEHVTSQYVDSRWVPINDFGLESLNCFNI